MSQLSEVEYYFVLNGLWNGEEGMFALPTGADGPDDEPQKDGWYWITDGMDDGAGPHKSRDAAIRAYNEHKATPDVD
jgi:hypothetical protein